MTPGRLLPVVLLALILAAASPAPAAEWGGLVAGETTMDKVRALYGQPTRTATQQVSGKDAAIWVYEGARAPRGIRRMTVEFGLPTPSGVRLEVVGIFRLEPAPGVFPRTTVILGWGLPTRRAPDGQPPVFFYDEGLLVYFDADGQNAQSLVFTPPLPPPPSGATRP